MGAYVNLKNRASQNRAQNRADETHLRPKLSALFCAALFFGA